MFTGIVAALGRIERVETLGPQAGVRLVVDAGSLDLSDVAVGDSIAIQGACMTVVRLEGRRFAVCDASGPRVEDSVFLFKGDTPPRTRADSAYMRPA